MWSTLAVATIFVTMVTSAPTTRPADVTKEVHGGDSLGMEIERKMEIVKINRNEYHFIFEDSGHTIGNLLQKQLLKDPYVSFAGYSVPHPLESKMIIRVMTSEKSPRELMSNAFNAILEQLETLSESLEQSEKTNQKDNKEDNKE